MEKFTRKISVDCNLSIDQPETGYRFSMDAVVLASHISLPTRPALAIDIGCGCGIISLMLAKKHPQLTIKGIEIQKELAEIARQNVYKNQLSSQINILQKDINNVDRQAIGKPADYIVTNPPYKKANTGRLNPDHQKAIARHEIYLHLDQLFECSNRLLSPNGKMYIVYPTDRLNDMKSATKKLAFFAESIRFIHTQNGHPAKRFIICITKKKTHPCTVLPPLILSENSTIV